MGKKKSGKFMKKDNNVPKKPAYYFDADDEDMVNDEIDAFHKQRDVVSLDVNKDVEDSDEDDEQPVFDLEDENEDKDDDDDEDEDDDDDEDNIDDSKLTGIAAKIVRQQKFLQAKTGGAEDEMSDDQDLKEEKMTFWRGSTHGADNVDYEIQSSDGDDPGDEEEEVLRLLKEKAENLSKEDFGLDDISEDESDMEPTIEETLAHGKSAPKVADKGTKDETGTIYEEVTKDLNALTREEQMDVVYSSAPELVGLLSELNYALDQLENKVDPLLSKIVERKDGIKGGLHYLEVKRLLLLMYCQAITFYLLFKSEGGSARDHPVIARLVELRTLLDKMKELDGHLPAELEDIINQNVGVDEQMKLVGENTASDSDSLASDDEAPMVPAESVDMTVPYEVTKTMDVDSSKDHKGSEKKRKQQDSDVGLQSMEMLKVRAALEERWKQKGVFTSLAQKSDRLKRQRQPMNGQLETWDDFGDEAMGGDASGRSSKLPHLVTSQMKKPKFISGDDDLPKRDDIGERRRKHEMRVLSRAGIEPVDEVDDEAGSDGVADSEVDGDSESNLEVYKQAEQKRAAKVAAKAELYSRASKFPSLPEAEVEGKRHISYQMEKNRGLTRSRNKDKKNPRVKYRTQHEKAVNRRKGQVRDIKKSTGPYGGEASGINAGISRSVRLFKG